MNQKQITVPRKLVYALGFAIFVVLLILAVRFPLSRSARSTDAASMAGSNLPAGSAEKFAFLSGQGTQRSVGST